MDTSTASYPWGVYHCLDCLPGGVQAALFGIPKVIAGMNDLNMAKKMDMDVMWMNNYGSSLIYGHPQGPTAGRLIAELIEEVTMLGGGYGLFAGCAAGDTAAAMVFKIG